ncbi:hypothetical protein KPATCC21470_2234 [Kitasatospora purpeofusca]
MSRATGSRFARVTSTFVPGSGERLIALPQGGGVFSGPRHATSVNTW